MLDIKSPGVVPFKVYHDGSKRVSTPDDPDNLPDGVFVVEAGLRVATGHTQMAVADAMMEFDQTTMTSRMLTGTAQMIRVTDGVAWVKGVKMGDADVTTVDKAMYKRLPGWLLSAWSTRLQELNGDNPMDAGKPDGETAGEAERGN